MNSLLSMLSSGRIGNLLNFSQAISNAVNAAKSGADPHALIEGLSNQFPELKDLDTSNLMSAAENLAKAKGANIEALNSQLDQTIDPMIKK